MSTSNTGWSAAIWPCDPRRGTAMATAINTIAISSSRMIRVAMDEPPAGVAAMLLTGCNLVRLTSCRKYTRVVETKAKEDGEGCQGMGAGWAPTVIVQRPYTVRARR